MAKPRHLARAPITEAVIDIHVAPRAGATFAELQAAFKALDFGFRQHSFVIAGTVGFTVNPDAEVQHSAGVERIGLRLHSEDEKYVLLIRTNGLSLSRLAPYETYEAVAAATRKLWDIYVNRWAPEKVTRVATRYINNLRLPMKDGQEFSEFIDTLTELPADVPQTMGPFLQQFNCMDRGSDCRVQLTLAWNGQGDQNGRVPVLLDIDASKTHEYQPTDSEIWSSLDALRALKNRCFFGTVTELALKEYE